ncbi:NAD(P)-dependent oxidoreductase [Phreatobacter aquaticus]|uniref:NAD(P)-dependent oxidoreductase n=1 Tax=Phreatobacter aquaticus TaxID=2570229 RepID=UPI00208E8E52|nr:NAD(P)-dependent oxidoreductase [Phreatobacter aquaticus]
MTHSADMLANYYGPRAVAALQEMAEVVINPTGEVLDEAGLIRHAQGVDIVVSDRQTPGFAGYFDQAPDLVAFLRCAVDIRNVDVERASRHGILCTRATPGFIDSVAELGFGMMIDLARNMSKSAEAYWNRREVSVLMGRQLKGSTLGILGYGAIGRRMAEIGLALGMDVLASDPHKTISDPGVAQVAMAELLERSDFVVCLVVATEATENLMNASAFAAMKPGAFFVNLSRGNLVDEQALEAALDSKQLAGAAMDVGRAPDQKPSLFLAERPDVIAAPHVGGLTPAAIEHQAFDTVEQVRALIAGEVPPGAVNAAEASRLSRLKV